MCGTVLVIMTAAVLRLFDPILGHGFMHLEIYKGELFMCFSNEFPISRSQFVPKPTEAISRIRNSRYE